MPGANVQHGAVGMQQPQAPQQPPLQQPGPVGIANPAAAQAEPLAAQAQGEAQPPAALLPPQMPDLMQFVAQMQQQYAQPQPGHLGIAAAAPAQAGPPAAQGPANMASMMQLWTQMQQAMGMRPQHNVIQPQPGGQAQLAAAATNGTVRFLG